MGELERLCAVGAALRVVASDMADTPWIPITAVILILIFVTVAIWRSAWVPLAALAGALLGAIAFLPVGGRVLDGPADCESCGTYITVLIGASFRTPYNGPRTAAIGAVVLGSVFALVAWRLSRSHEQQRGK